MAVNPNEIRDYVERAPKRWSFDGARMINHTGARLRWLEQLCRGTLHERINRRAGISFDWIYAPWKPDRVISAAARWHRRQSIIQFGRR